MVKSLSTRVILALAAVAAVAALAVTTAGTAPADAGGHTGGVIQGTTDSLSPDELALLQSDRPASVEVDVETGNISSITPIDAD